MEVLAGSELFGKLPDKQLRAIHEVGRQVAFAPGEELTSEGHEGQIFYLILEGTAEVRVRGVVRRTVARGDGVGEIALLDGQPRSASVVATSPLRTFSLASWNFRPLISEREISEAVIGLLCSRLRESEAARAT
jgi:CRP-like cAMP-binding protein